ncbi:MAG TPA: 50S ribosomal protein L10 [Firmicutes bacterium]|nr:50S ribosomal protein L10 [Bacillota bacterium]
MARPEKEAVVAELKDKFGRAQAVVLTDYRGLTVAEVTELRKRLREAGLEYKVVKNTLTRLAVNELVGEDLDPYLVGPTALAFSYEDPVAPAKILTEFAKSAKALQIKGALLEDEVIDSDAVKALADLPPYDILVAQLLGVLQAPVRGLVTVLGGPQRKLVYALDAIREKKENVAS